MNFPSNHTYRSHCSPSQARPVRRLAYAIGAGGICGAELCAAFASFGFEGLPFLDWLAPNAAAAYAFIAVLTAFLIGGMYAALGFHPVAHDALDGKSGAAARGRIRRPSFAFDAKHVALWAAVIFICWLPVLIMKYPCTLNGDTINQFFQFQTPAPTYYTTMHEFVPGEFVDHHPVFDTLLYGSFLTLGDALGSQNAGIFILVVLQSLVLAAALSAACCFGSRLNAPFGLQAASLLFFALWPLFPNYSAAVLKDTSFLAPWVLFLICWLEAWRSRGDALSHAKFLAVLIAASILCILTKKVGMYVVAPSLLVLLVAAFARRQGKARTLGALTAFATPILICSLIIPLFVYPAIGGVSPGGKQEPLGFAFQQSIAVLRSNPSSVTQQEYHAINAVLDVQAAETDFSGNITDKVKSKYRANSTDAQLKSYLAAWLSVGLKNPGLYLATTLTTTYHFFVPSAYLAYYDTPGQGVSKDYYWAYDSQRDFTKLFESFDNGFHISLHRPAHLISLTSGYDAAYRTAESLPVISLLFTQGLYGGWIPLLCFAATLYKRKRDAWAFAPIALTAVFMLLSPVDATRYMLPMLTAAPLLLYWTYRSFLPTESDPGNAAGARPLPEQSGAHAEHYAPLRACRRHPRRGSASNQG